jgi:hypothetical protein
VKRKEGAERSGRNLTEWSGNQEQSAKRAEYSVWNVNQEQSVVREAGASCMGSGKQLRRRVWRRKKQRGGERGAGAESEEGED